MRRTLPALLGLLLAAPLAGAAMEVVVGDSLAPAFDAFEEGADLVAPSLPGAGALAQALAEAGRAWAGATLVGASDGDAGAELGGPDAVGLQVAERAVVPPTPPGSVEVPAQDAGLALPGFERSWTLRGGELPPQELATYDRQVVVVVPGIDGPRFVVVTGPVEMPALGLEAPGLAVPGFEVPTPGVGVPPLVAEVPALGVPGVDVVTPPLALTTPPLATPPLQAVVPGADVPPGEHEVDLAALAVPLQPLRGTLYLGAVSVPYEVDAQAPADALPPEVPRSVGASTPPLHADPVVLVEDPGRTVVPAQVVALPPQHLVRGDPLPLLPAQEVAAGGLEVLPPGAAGHEGLALLEPTEVTLTGPLPLAPGQELVLLPGGRLVEAQTLATVLLPGQTVTLPGFGVGDVSVHVRSEPREVARVTSAGQSVPLGIVVLDDPVLVPGAGHAAPLPPAELGYFGYGRGADSSLYPYACAPVAGCVHGSTFVRPYVALADATLDAAAAALGGELLVEA